MNQASDTYFEEGEYSNNILSNGVINIVASTSRILSKQEEETDPKILNLSDRNLAGLSHKVIFSSVIFENNKGKNGAAIYTLNSPLTITSCTFKNNKASAEGGAIYFSA